MSRHLTERRFPVLTRDQGVILGRGSNDCRSEAVAFAQGDGSSVTILTLLVAFLQKISRYLKIGSISRYLETAF